MRCLASGSFILRNIFAMGITLYTPSVALNTVGGVPYWITLLGMTTICILFTLLVSFCDLTEFLNYLESKTIYKVT